MLNFEVRSFRYFGPFDTTKSILQLKEYTHRFVFSEFQEIIFSPQIFFHSENSNGVMR